MIHTIQYQDYSQYYLDQLNDIFKLFSIDFVFPTTKKQSNVHVNDVLQLNNTFYTIENKIPIDELTPYIQSILVECSQNLADKNKMRYKNWSASFHYLLVLRYLH
jgi:hypothetical protein